MEKLSINQAGPQLDIRFYEIDPAQKDQFLEFYHTRVRPWLIEGGTTQAQVWLVERDEGLQFIYVSLDGPPWDTFEGLEQFLKGSHPLRVQALPNLGISESRPGFWRI